MRKIGRRLRLRQYSELIKPVSGRRGVIRGSLQAGFTLVEMLVVLAIIGLVVGLAGPRVINYLSDSKVKAAQIQMESLANSLELFFLDTGRYPTTAENLTALVVRPSSVAAWNGPYLKSSAPPKDPWGRSYIYRSPADARPFEIGSSGPDAANADRIAVQRMQDAAK